MPDAPDSYFYSHISSLTPSTDVNELAAKLGSPSTNFREGQIIWQTDFREGFKGIDTEVIPGTSSAYITENGSTLTGMTAIIETDSSDFSDAYFGKELPLYDAEYFIYSLLFTMSSTDAQVWLELYIDKDGYQYRPQLKYTSETEEMLYLADDNTFKTLSLPQDIFRGPGMNMRFHLKVDVRTGKYVSLYINDFNIDMSDKTMRSLASSNAEHTTIYLSVRSTDGNTRYVYVNGLSLACSD